MQVLEAHNFFYQLLYCSILGCNSRLLASLQLTFDQRVGGSSLVSVVVFIP